MMALVQVAPVRAMEKTSLAATPNWFAHSGQAYSHYGTSSPPPGMSTGMVFRISSSGAPDYDDGETDEGKVYVYYGSLTGLDPLLIGPMMGM